ncbi:octopamine receptor beta-2R-like [Exaiptasia diaphana]|uniref:G-protein coupled receptors family 1 profile domain-containing protein n=1 Tax=Exaiptasia diaphana TaxID=2652724 RepID=A0A913XRP0_EXADI|nr:octopamine receptor beta-2R-like [Exaiptasia diaphana]
MSTLSNKSMNSTDSSVVPRSMPKEIIIFIAILIVFEILTLIGNGFVVYLVAVKRRLHTNTNWLVLSLAVSDLAVALAIIPSRIACFRHVCDVILMKILYDIFIFISLCNLCCLTLDRFIAVMRPLKYYSTITYSLVVKLIVASWFIPTIVFCIPLTWTYGYENDILLRKTADKIFYMTQIIIFMCVPCLVMFVAYAFILSMALKQAKRIQSLRQSVVGCDSNSNSYSAEAKNTIKVFGVVYMMFVFCWIMSAYRTIKTFYHEGGVHGEVTLTSRLLLVFNSCVNPIVYALWKKDIRSELKKLFKIRSRRDNRLTLDNRGPVNNSCDVTPTDDVSLSSNLNQKTADRQNSDLMPVESKLLNQQTNEEN